MPIIDYTRSRAFILDAADRLEAVAQYVQEHKFQDMTADLERAVRRRPAQSLVAAAVAGFLVGRLVRREG
jgi:hypothetical protein